MTGVDAEPAARAVVAPPRPRVSLRSRCDFVFDAVLLMAFAIAYTFNLTGTAIHEWFGLAFGLALLVHLTLHWDWVLRTTRRMFTTAGRRRLMWIVNALLLVDLTFCVASGILISEVAIPALGLRIAGVGGFWSELHTRTADAAIVLIAVHVGLDWRWLVTVAKRWRARSSGVEGRTPTTGRAPTGRPS